MLRVSTLEKKLAEPDIYLTDTFTLDGARLIPVNISNSAGRLSDHVNQVGKQFLTAAAEGNTNEIRRLLTEGAPFTADWLGTSPLHLAAQGNHVDVCEILLRAGISTNARTKVDRTPLHMAAYEGHLEVVELLLGDEAEIDCTDLLGMTPLHWAVQNGHAEIVRALLKFGAHKQMENKFGLKPLQIALQMNRLDIADIIREEQHEDPTFATENLAIEMAAEDENEMQTNESQHMEEADELPDQFDDSIQQIELNSSDENNTENTLSDSMKILQEHGITMLPNDDDNNILSSVMESGHSVVLTDIGKQVLDSVKASEEASENITRDLGKKNYITVSADEFLALAANASISKNQAQFFRQVDGKFVPKTVKRIVMKKNKVQPISPIPNILKQKSSSQPNQVNQLTPPTQSSQVTSPKTQEMDVESIMKQLYEARKTIEEYKEKLIQKEAEAERYKQQLNLLMGYS